VGLDGTHVNRELLDKAPSPWIVEKDLKGSCSSILDLPEVCELTADQRAVAPLDLGDLDAAIPELLSTFFSHP
jgi:hypothetical protein